jgi:hypothetical protein
VCAFGFYVAEEEGARFCSEILFAVYAVVRALCPYLYE